MALTDLTRISTSGIATGTSLSGAILHGDAHFRGTNAGINSAIFDSSENELKFNDNVKAKFGDGGDVQLYWTGSAGFLTNQGGGNLHFNSDTVLIKNAANSKSHIRAYNNSSVEIFHNNNKKIETTKHGAVVTGILTATSFSGPIVGSINNPSGISTFYDLRVSNNLTVEGTTTTLDTNLIGVDRIEVGANSNTIVGVAITQSGTADILNLYDGSTEVFSVADGGNVTSTGDLTISSILPRITLNDTNNESDFDIKNENGSFRIRDLDNPTDRYRINSSGGTIHEFFGTANFSSSINVSSGNITASDGGVLINGAGGAILYLNDSDDNPDYQVQNIGGTFAIKDGTNNAERLRITSTGDVQVNGGSIQIDGTGEFAVFESDTSLSFNNSAQISLDFSSNVARIRSTANGSGSNRPLALCIGSSQKLHISTGGDVGVGNDSPNCRLAVKDTAEHAAYANVTPSVTACMLQLYNNPPNETANDHATLQFGVNGGSHNRVNSISAVAESAGNRKLAFTFCTDEAGSRTEKLRITGDGNVGIGTNNPGATLTVQSDSSNTSLTGHNYLASQSGIILQNRTISSGHFTAYTGNVRSSGGYTQSGSLAFESTGSGTAPKIHITQRTGGGVQTKRLTIDTDGTVIFANKLTNSSSFTSHNTNFYGGDVNTGGVRIELAHSTTTVSGNTASGAFPHHLLLSNYSGNGSADNRMCSIGFDIPTTSLHANATIAYQATAPGAGDFQFWLESGNTSYERLRITSDGKIGIGHHIATQITKELTIRPADGGGILMGRPGDTVAPINVALQITTRTSGSEAYHTEYHTSNCNAMFTTHEGGGTGGNIIFQTGVGAGNDVERLRINNLGIHKITTPGSTTDGTYFSTLTINNTGSSTWSRLRFDRGGVARWGLALGTDDKFRISNLYTNGSTGSPDDDVFVIANNSHIGINEASPQSILDVRSDISSHPLGAIFRKDYGGDTTDASHKVALTIWGQDHNDLDHTGQDAYGPMIGFGTRNDDSAPNTGDIRAAISYRYNGQLTFHTEAGGSVTDGSNERLRITGNGKIGINNTDPSCRTGGIDMSSNDGTSGKSFTDLRGHSMLILRNPSTNHHSFTQLLFENGGGTSAATMFRHRLGPSSGSQQNFVGDLCLFRRTGNAGGANNDYRESTRWCGATEQARQIWWASGDTDTGGTTRLGWHHLSASRDHPGTDAYTFFRLEIGSASYARNGMGKYTVVWTTGHASGYGLQIGHFGYYMPHGSSTIVVNEHIIHRERYSNGSYYGWNDSPNMRIINNTASGGTNAAISFRCGGRRHAGYDMSVVVGIFIDLYAPESANGDTNPRLYVAGNSESNLSGGGFGTPVNHAFVSFQSSNPNHSGQP